MSHTVANLAKSEAKALDEFKAKLKQEAIADEETLLRFLKAREFNVELAHRQYMSTWEWRRNNDIDNILNAPRPLEEKLKNVLSYGFHKIDKEGRPCYIEKTGKADINALLKLPEDQLIKWHVWNTEKQIEQMNEKSGELNKEITTLVHIHDLSRATLNMRKALNLFTRLVKLDQEYYPERMGKVFIINTPWIFPVLWKVARSFLDPKTRDKCIVLSSLELNQLIHYFNAEDLPEEYGGTCRCEHGCLPEVPKHMLSCADDEAELTEECIAARSTFSQKVECKGNNGSIGWFYRISSKDIKFGVKFRKFMKEEWVVKLEHPLHATKANIGFHTCSSSGVYTLVWDNSNSRFLSRTLKYHIMTEDHPASQDG